MLFLSQMASYHHLAEAGIETGREVPFGLCQISPLGDVDIQLRRERVEGLAGGGFHGSVVLLRDDVIKTARPDSLRQLVRDINWPWVLPMSGDWHISTLSIPSSHGYDQLLRNTRIRLSRNGLSVCQLS
jgi:hypothetical protein